MKLTILLFMALPAFAEQNRWHTAWKWSVAALAAGNAMDAASSHGQREFNPVLGQQFGARSSAIKFGIVGGAVVAQYLISRKLPQAEKPLAIINFSMAGAFVAASVRNVRMQ